MWYRIKELFLSLILLGDEEVPDCELCSGMGKVNFRRWQETCPSCDGKGY